MKILLVYPGTLDGQGRPIKFRKAYMPPLSLATLAALTPRQHTVTVINDLVENLDYSAGWDLVGVTATTVQAVRAYQIADEFRRRGTKVVIGGIHAFMCGAEARQHADAIVIGEAENIWPVVVADAADGRLRERYEDTDLPSLQDPILPRWECFNLNVYLRRPGARMPMLPIFTTRGCPYGCRFCSVTKFSGRKYRTRPVGTVLREIESPRAREFFFVDDNIMAAPEYARELFTALRGRNLRWMSQASTTMVKHPDLLEKAAAAGCYALFIGIESLSKDTLANAHKSFNKVDQYEELLMQMRTAGITPFFSFIFGFDEDTPELFDVTVRFLKKYRVGSPLFWILTPFPGTDIYEDMRQAGRITSTDWSQFDATQVVFRPKTWAPQDLADKYWTTFERWYRPPRFLRNIWWNARYSSHPVETFIRGAFFQPNYWWKLRRRRHPYAGGV